MKIIVSGLLVLLISGCSHMSKQARSEDRAPSSQPQGLELILATNYQDVIVTAVDSFETRKEYCRQGERLEKFDYSAAFGGYQQEFYKASANTYCQVDTDRLCSCHTVHFRKKN